jgi:hypothetical protein
LVGYIVDYNFVAVDHNLYMLVDHKLVVVRIAARIAVRIVVVDHMIVVDTLLDCRNDPAPP